MSAYDESAEAKRCVLVQCATLVAGPEARPPRLFTTPVTLWTVAALLGGIVDGIQGPIADGVHPFHLTDEGFFQYTTYGGGSGQGLALRRFPPTSRIFSTMPIVSTA